MSAPADRKLSDRLLDVQDTLNELRQQVEGIRLMAVGAGVDTSSPEITTPIVDAAFRVSDGIKEVRETVAALMREVEQ